MKKAMLFIFMMVLLTSFVFAANSCSMEHPVYCLDSKVTNDEISIMIQFPPDEINILDGAIIVDNHLCRQNEYLDFTKSPMIMACSKKSDTGKSIKGDVILLAQDKEGNQKNYTGSFERKAEYIKPIDIDQVLPENVIGCTFRDPNLACIDFKVDIRIAEILIQKADSKALADLTIIVNGKDCEQIGAWDLSANPLLVKCAIRNIDRKAEGKIQVAYYDSNDNLKTTEGFFRGYVGIPVKEDTKKLLEDVTAKIYIPRSVQKITPEIKDIEPKIIVYRNVCEGCLKDNKCYPYGLRLDEKYCDVTKELLLQKERQEPCNDNFECKTNVCRDGLCKNSCEGCQTDKDCVSYGTRFQSKYCSIDGIILDEKQVGLDCSNNYECSSNLCVNNKCVSQDFIQKLLVWFRRLFRG
ncbi:hypothetical protein JXA85_08545 [Candidatus Woesearchaeota archaeon]|nr:hypothetical protein [Candidatus Woesearchaeota archaeon]